jgi:hypothetical protein
MKKIIFLMLISYHCFGQLPTKDGHVFYESIDTLTLTKDQLYTKAKLWIANTFKDSKSVIEIDDKENGQIVGKGNFVVNYTYALTPSTCRFNFTVRIDLKDNKYRLQLYNIIGEFAANYETPIEEIPNQYGKKIAGKLLPEANKRINELITDFRINLSKQNNDSF